ncbi:MAG: hypothetical protein Q8J65_03755, partial [Nitrosomonadales bacterium]|nr:hypothetical protein [Nitrosomonadales bacterium]
MMKSLNYLPVILFVAHFGSACSLTLPASVQHPDTPQEWRHADVPVPGESISNEWWQSFGSTELDALITAASADS